MIPYIGAVTDILSRKRNVIIKMYPCKIKEQKSQTLICTPMHMRVHTDTHKHTHTHTHPIIHIYSKKKSPVVCVYVYVCIVKPDILYIDIVIHPSIHTYTHIHTHTHTHTHILACMNAYQHTYIQYIYLNNSKNIF